MIETRSRRKLLLFLLCISLLGYASAQTTLDGLHDSIKKVVSAAPIGAEWGILATLIDIRSNKTSTLFSQDIHIMKIPASNTKLATSIPAYDELGPNYKIKTTISSHCHSTGKCDIVVKGGADPSLTSAQLDSAISELSKKSSVTEITRMTMDGSFLDASSTLIPSTWEWSDLRYYYGARPGSFIINENTMTLGLTSNSSSVSYVFTDGADKYYLSDMIRDVQLGGTTSIDFYFDASGRLVVLGSIVPAQVATALMAIPTDPTRYFCLKTIGAFLKAGVKASYQICDNLSPKPSAPEIASVEILAPPLFDLITHCLKISDNLYAETFLRHLGRNAGGTNAVWSGRSAVKDWFLKNARVPTNNFYQDDGSGLSRANQIPPFVFHSALESLYLTKKAYPFITFLPIAGVDGTLKTRMRGTVAQGIVHAKTGTVLGVNSLSGYILPQSSNYVGVFSIIVNGTPLSPSNDIRALIDKVVVALTTYILSLK